MNQVNPNQADILHTYLGQSTIIPTPLKFKHGTWKWKPKEKEIPFSKTIIFRFYVKLWGCKLELRGFVGGESPDPQPPIWGWHFFKAGSGHHNLDIFPLDLSDDWRVTASIVPPFSCTLIITLFFHVKSVKCFFEMGSFSKTACERNTVDGQNPANQLIWYNIPLITTFYTSKVVQDFFHQQYHPWWRLWNNLRLHLRLQTKAKEPSSIIPSSTHGAYFPNFLGYKLKHLSSTTTTWIML